MKKIIFDNKIVNVLLIISSFFFVFVVIYFGLPALRYFFEVDVATRIINTSLFLYIFCLGGSLFFLGLRKDGISNIFVNAMLVFYVFWLAPMMYFMIKSWI